MAKGKANINIFKTNSGEGARVTIPKAVVDELKIKGMDIFSQKRVGRHIEMERTCIIDDECVSISQFKTPTNVQTKTVILKQIATDLKLKNKDMMLFETKGNKIYIKKF